MDGELPWRWEGGQGEDGRTEEGKGNDQSPLLETDGIIPQGTAYRDISCSLAFDGTPQKVNAKAGGPRAVGYQRVPVSGTLCLYLPCTHTTGFHAILSPPAWARWATWATTLGISAAVPPWLEPCVPARPISGANSSPSSAIRSFPAGPAPVRCPSCYHDFVVTCPRLSPPLGLPSAVHVHCPCPVLRVVLSCPGRLPRIKPAHAFLI